MKSKIIKVYEENGQRLFDVKFGNEKFEGIEAIERSNKCGRDCKYYHECDISKVFRKFDCQRNLDWVEYPYMACTMLVLGYLTYIIFKNLEYGFFAKTAILVVAGVVLDIVCTCIEEIAPKICDWFFYKKLKKAKKKKEELEETKRQAEETQKQREEAERIAKSPDYRKVIEAKEIVQRLKDFSEKYDFGPNEEKIDICVEKSEAILQKLQEDSSGYVRVAYLFEAYLPEFCNTLSFYVDFVKAEAVTEEHERNLTECVNIILEFLEEQKVKSIFDKEYVQSQFQASVDTLKGMLKEELDK